MKKMLMVLIGLCAVACSSPVAQKPVPVVEVVSPEPVFTIQPVVPIDLVPRVGSLTISAYNCHTTAKREVWTEVEFRNDSNKIVLQIQGHVLFRSKTRTIRADFEVRTHIQPRAQNVTGPVLHKVTAGTPKDWTGLRGCQAVLEAVQYEN